MSWSVASVTVSYNAAHLLPRQIEGLLAQSRPLQEIIVLDNASSDGTGALLAKRYPQVRVVSLAENAGAGGALAAGLAYAALEKRHDWIWMLDDDSVPDSNTVEALLDGAESLQDSGDEVGILAPMSIHRETGTPYPPLLWRDGWVKLSTEAMRQPTCFVDLVISSGSMVQRKVVEAIGLPRADFFMDFFDFEYC